jgi:cytochrome c peroxidase
VVAAGALGCEGDGPGESSPLLTPGTVEAALSMSPLPAPPADPTNAWAEDPDAARFGQRLFFDSRLSANGEVSCATCHDPALGFADGLKVGQGLGVLGRHTPSLWNTAYNRWFFWDGRADTQWAQATKPLEHPKEQGMSRLELAHLLHDDPALRGEYEALFGPLPPLDDEARFPPAGRPLLASDDDPALLAAWDGMALDDRDAVDGVLANAVKAIAAYERRLIRGDAPFDRYVEGLRTGDESARSELPASAVRGMELFLGRARCVECHSGPNFTDNEFHNIGLERRSWLPDDDGGRAAGIPLLLGDGFNGQGAHSDAPDSAANTKLDHVVLTGDSLGSFKTPSLRNVALSPPYMHGGHFDTLEDVVRFYSELDETVELGHREETLVELDLTEAEIADLVAFLESLTGAEPDPTLLAPPPP